MISPIRKPHIELESHMVARKKKRKIRQLTAVPHTPSDTRSKAPIYVFLALLLVTAVAVLYAGSLQYPLAFDDVFFQEAALREYGRSWFKFDLRWFAHVTFGWTYNLFGLNWSWYRAGNIFLHALTAVALFAFLWRLFDAVCKPAAAPSVAHEMSHSQMAFFGALIFALHPVSVYAVTYLVQRSIVMATLFCILSLWFYLEGLLRGRRKWFIWSALLYFLAVFSKEHCVMLPGVALALTLLFRKPSWSLLRELWLPAGLFLLAGAAIVLKAKGYLGAAYEPYAAQAVSQLSESTAYRSGQIQVGVSSDYIYARSAITESWLFFKYLFLWFLPNPAWMSVDLRQNFASGLFVWPETAGFAAFVLYPFAALALLLKGGRKGLLGFGMLFPWILYLTEVSTVRIQEPFVLYRAYLWTSGLTILIPLLVPSMAVRWKVVLLSGICIVLVPLSLNRLDSFSSVWKLWNDVVEKNSDNHLIFVERGLSNRGMASMDMGNYPDALRDFNAAIAINSKDADLYINRGTLYLKTSSYESALEDLNTAIRLNDKSAEAFSQRCVLYIRLSQHQQGLPDCDRAIELDGRHQIAHINRGIIRATDSHFPEALEDFERAVEINGNNPVAHFNRGRVLRLLSRELEATVSLRKSCELGFPPACDALSTSR